MRTLLHLGVFWGSQIFGCVCVLFVRNPIFCGHCSIWVCVFFGAPNVWVYVRVACEDSPIGTI